MSEVVSRTPNNAPVLIIDAPGTPPPVFTPTPPRTEAPRARWLLRTLDGTDSYELHRNPNRAGDAFITREIAWNSHRGVFTGTRAPRAPQRWEFSGVLHDREQYQALQAWLARRRKVELVTDLGEVHVVRLLSFAPEAVGGRRNPWRMAYTVTALLYDEVRPA